MEVRVVRNSLRGCPSDFRTSGLSDQSEFHVKIGILREVYAMSYFMGVVFVLIRDDLEMFSWIPSWLFEVTDSNMPQDWKIGLFHDQPSAVIGPAFISESLEGYRRFVEQEPEAIQQLWQRIDAVKVVEADQ